MGEGDSLGREGCVSAVFLDRDGVLNESIVRDGKPYSPRTRAEFRVIEEARLACRLLVGCGFTLLGVSNQPDVARGEIDPALVESFNALLCQTLALREVLVCPHDDADQCDCRKPKPGLLLAAAKKYDIALQRSFMIGDRWRDIEAGRAAGCRTIWIDRGYSEPTPVASDFVTDSVLSAAKWIVVAAKVSSERGAS